MSNVSQLNQDSANSTQSVNASLDLAQLIKGSYGITLPMKCESRLREAALLTIDDVNHAMQQLRRGTDLDQDEGCVKVQADHVEQLYHLTENRNELSLETKPTPTWTACQFEDASELTKLMSKESKQGTRQALSLVTELAEDLALVDLDRVNA